MKVSFSFHTKRFIAAPILAFACSALCLSFGATWKIAPLLALLFLGSGAFSVHVSGKASGIIWVGIASIAAAMTIFLSQEANGIRKLLPVKYYAIAILAVFSLMLCLYLLTLLFSRGMPRLSIALVAGGLLLISVVNYYLVQSRGTELNPFDLLGTRTAMNVLSSYHIALTVHICYVIAFYVLLLFFMSGISAQKSVHMGRYRLCVLGLTILTTFIARTAVSTVPIHLWINEPSVTRNGYLLNFLAQLNSETVPKPEDYSADVIRQIERDYSAPSDVPELLPNIVVIMNESLADLRVFGELETDQPVMPFLDSLSENTIKGMALSSVYGGKTPNSEFEFLLGDSMAFLNPAEIPFMHLLKTPCYSLARYLAGFGYESYATHPENGANWDRDRVYPHLGFDRIEFLEDYEDLETIYYFATDKSMYAHLMQRYQEAAERENPQFFFAVTVQNHGDYNKPDFPPSLSVKGFENREVNTYLSLVHESDRAFEELIRFFGQQDEPVIVLLYGDHQPSMPDSFLEWLNKGSLDSLDKLELKYEIPYWIWANFDIEEREEDLTSINYLSSILLDAAGLPLSPYNAFLKQTRQTIPALNAYGYYSQSEACFLPVEEAEGAEKEALSRYACLCYNSLKDTKGRSELFFPVE